MGAIFAYHTEINTPNRWHGGNQRTHICAHHWGNPDHYGPDESGVVSWLTNPSAQASAHFVVTEDRVWCLAACSDRTWSTGTREGNNTAIAIEAQPDASARTQETYAALVAVIWHWYPHLKGRPLVPHSRWVPTACPGYYHQLIDSIRRRALELYPVVDPNNPGQLRSANLPAGPKYTKNPDTASTARLAVDGWCGPLTVRAWQEALGTPVDGVISSQPTGNGKYLLGMTAVQYSSRPYGSTMIKALQRRLKARGLYNLAIDGLIGPGTIRGLQRRYGTPVDGIISGPSTVIRAVQRDLNG